MRIRLPIFAFMLLVLVSCDNDGPYTAIDTFQDDPTILGLHGTWKVVSFEEYGKVEVKNARNSEGLDIIITFNDRASPKQFFGENTTNVFEVEFEYIASRTIKIERFLSTEVGGPEWGQMFTRTLHVGEFNFKINTAELKISSLDQTKSVTLAKL